MSTLQFALCQMNYGEMLLTVWIPNTHLHLPIRFEYGCLQTKDFLIVSYVETQF